MKNYYVSKPDLTPYEGIKVTKKTKLTFDNGRVKQDIKNLKLHSVYTYQNERYTSKNVLDVNLKEGDILLLEEENRGYFLPLNAEVETIERAIEDYEALNIALRGDGTNDVKRNEEKSVRTD